MESLKSYSETLVWVLSMACLRSRTSPHGEVCGKLCLHVAASVEPQPTSCDRPGVTFGQQSGQKARYGRGEQEQVGIHFDTCDSLSLFLTAAVFQGQWLSPHFRFPNRIPYSPHLSTLIQKHTGKRILGTILAKPKPPHPL